MGCPTPVLKTAPAIEPVTVAEFRAYLRLSDTSQDTMLSSMLVGARELVEDSAGISLITRTYQMYFDGFPDTIELERPPIQSITSIKYLDTDGVQQTLTAVTDYRVDVASMLGRITPAHGTSWPSTQDVTNSVEVEYKAGYGDNAINVKQIFKSTIMAVASDMFEHPELSSESTLSENKTFKYMMANISRPGVG